MAASISGICSSSPSLKSQTKTLFHGANCSLRKDSLSFPIRPKLNDGRLGLGAGPAHSVAKEIPVELSAADVGLKKEKKGLEKDPHALWSRYVDWLYQHKELGLFLDVSRIGFTDEFLAEMEPRFQAAFRDMEALEKGSIANPDEGRMVGHYWLRNSELAPTSFLRSQIDNTLDAVCSFADDIISGKVSFHGICLPWPFSWCFSLAYFFVWLRTIMAALELCRCGSPIKLKMHCMSRVVIVR